MKTGKLIMVVPAVLAMSLGLINVSFAETPVVQIHPNFQPDPLTLQGTSGGPHSSKCGNISTTPNQVIDVTQPLPYLRLTAESSGQPTLTIDGPGGHFCVLADSYSGGKPEISGYWQKGKYSLYVGELSQRQYTYTLSISQQKKK